MTSIPLHSDVPLAGDAPARQPLLTILPAGPWAALDLRELWRFRDLVVTLAVRDVKLRYRQTALGSAWVVIQPLLNAGIFTLVFGKMMGVKGTGGVPYFLFAYAGQMAWQAFQTTLTKCGNCLVGNSHLVSKVYFPRLVLPLSTIFSALVDFLVAAPLLVVLMIVFRIQPHWGMLLIPVWLALLTTFAMGIGLFMSSLMVTYRDVQYVLPVMIQMLMYASPVGYPLSQVPAAYRFWYGLNPLAGLLEAFRFSILGKGEMPWAPVLFATAATILIGVFGAVSFKRMERGFADVI